MLSYHTKVEIVKVIPVECIIGTAQYAAKYEGNQGQAQRINTFWFCLSFSGLLNELW